MRIRFVIAYNGARFLGSQTQTQTKNTVLGQIEHVFDCIGIKNKIVASGRTDAGVHATAQTCHVDLPDFWNDLTKLQRVLNEMLPTSIVVKSIKEVSLDFHARFSATKRVYRYVLCEGASNPFEDDFVTFRENLDFTSMEKNIKLFEGIHDFVFFMKAKSDVTTTTRTIYKTRAYQYKKYIILSFEANGFLRSQIRMMVGALLVKNQKEIEELITCQKKHRFKPAPANGLYLAKISYKRIDEFKTV
ncbi:MAG: tRNA pseudouridine(38-40) synthase TruA [Sulfurimonadaceae bacterium]|jgi:tRNA pseudouridine38-40 synthase|nr:tRNA pseudouridine(38-40) synthase TruA [Sulfurimonadaceae bacterium]